MAGKVDDYIYGIKVKSNNSVVTFDENYNIGLIFCFNMSGCN